MRLHQLVLPPVLFVLAACMPTQRPMKEYAYPAWGFAVSLPAAPVVKAETPPPGSTTPRTFQVEVRDANHDYVVSCTDTSLTDKSDDEILNGAPAMLAQAAGAKAGVMTYVATGKTVGREARMDIAGQAPTRVRFYVAGKTFYQVVSQSTGGVTDPEATRVLDSFRLLAAK
jgi:hypothetical protein